MRTVILVIVLIIGMGVAGYFALPVVIEQQTGGLRTEVSNLKQRLESAEIFVKGEQEARKNVQIEPAADIATVSRAVNALASKVTKLESSVRADLSAADSEIKSKRAQLRQL